MKTVSVKAIVNPDGQGLTFLHKEVLAPTFIPKAGEEVDVDITFGKVKRTLAQNRLLWGVAYEVIAYEMANKFGEVMPKEVTHAHNLQVIQGVKLEWFTLNGQDVLVVKDKKSSDMTKEEFSEMYENLRDWYAVNKDIHIPESSGDNTLNDHIR